MSRAGVCPAPKQTLPAPCAARSARESVTTSSGLSAMSQFDTRKPNPARSRPPNAVRNRGTVQTSALGISAAPPPTAGAPSWSSSVSWSASREESTTKDSAHAPPTITEPPPTLTPSERACITDSEDRTPRNTSACVCNSPGSEASSIRPRSSRMAFTTAAGGLASALRKPRLLKRLRRGTEPNPAAAHQASLKSEPLASAPRVALGV
mmetsp:Transcript_8760/g.22315  ORF Transcript_8760/g.22315 Transcript_8760/m.22315 type:complete len:208 (-) Transcript_8760:1128-1751(-)